MIFHFSRYFDKKKRYNNNFESRIKREKMLNFDFVEIKGNKVFLKNGKLDLNSLCIEDISEIKGLAKLVTLRELDLSNNQIMEIHGLNSLINLRKLDLSKNDIQEIRNIEKLRKLEELILNDLPIPITTLDKLGGLDDNGIARNLKLIQEHSRDQSKKYPEPAVKKSFGMCKACGGKIRVEFQVICEFCGADIKK